MRVDKTVWNPSKIMEGMTSDVSKDIDLDTGPEPEPEEAVAPAPAEEEGATEQR